MTAYPSDSFPSALKIGGVPAFATTPQYRKQIEQLENTIRPFMERASKSPMHALGEIVGGLADDGASRTAAVTALVASFWQLAGRTMTERVPSLILLDASEADSDPLGAFVGQVAGSEPHRGPAERSSGPLPFLAPENAPRMMRHLLRVNKKHRAQGWDDPPKYEEFERQYFEAQRIGFGSGRRQPYARACHDEFGLLTDSDGEIILRLEGENDQILFRRHVLGSSDMLRCPRGYGPGLNVVGKRVCVSGSMTPVRWDDRMARSMTGLGLPFLFLPHPVRQPISPPLPSVGILGSYLNDPSYGPIEVPANMAPVDDMPGCVERMRGRLRHLPCDFEFLMQRMVRQVFPVCSRIGFAAARLSPEAVGGDADNLALGLCAHTLRGIVIGVAGLAWHGLGFDSGLPAEKTRDALACLRRNGTMTRSEFLRAAHLKKGERDVLLERCAAEGLVVLEDKTVRAVTYRDFVLALYAREEFPEPYDYWADLVRKDSSASAG